MVSFWCRFDVHGFRVQFWYRCGNYRIQRRRSGPDAGPSETRTRFLSVWHRFGVCRFGMPPGESANQKNFLDQKFWSERASNQKKRLGSEILVGRVLQLEILVGNGRRPETLVGTRNSGWARCFSDSCRVYVNCQTKHVVSDSCLTSVNCQIHHVRY